MTDTKHGFIITYFKTCQEGQKMLEDLIEKISLENYYLVLATHSPVSAELQSKCDFYIYQDLNIVDDRKYSHGVAENNLIELALHHLRYKKIEWTYKVCYDVTINDASIFENWKQDYNYKFVSCYWGSNIICTNSFFANVDFILSSIDFYHSIESMFDINNVLENCWEKNIRDRNLVNQTYAYKDKQDFFGPNNKIDNLFYNYHDIEFAISNDNSSFFIKTGEMDLKGEICIRDFYTDLCIYRESNWSQDKGLIGEIKPDTSIIYERGINGYYLEIIEAGNGLLIKRSIKIKDFNSKHPEHKKLKQYNPTKNNIK